MSALPPKADIKSDMAHVCFVPKGDVGFPQSDNWLHLLLRRPALVGPPRPDLFARDQQLFLLRSHLRSTEMTGLPPGKALWLCERGTNVRQSKRAIFDHWSTDRCGRSAWLQSLSGSKATRGPPDKCWSEWREDPRKVESGCQAS
jgi:hypothetical protein